MPTPIKLTLFFSAGTSPKVGDSETYYLANGDPYALIGQVPASPGHATPMGLFLEKRLRLLHNLCTLDAVRAAADDGSRQSQYMELNSAQWKGQYSGAAVPNPVESFASVMVQWVANNPLPAVKKQSWMFGAPETIVRTTTAQGLNREVDFFNRFPQFFNAAKSLGVCLRTRKAAGAHTIDNLTAFQVDPTSRYAFLQPVPGSFPIADPGFVLLRGTKNPRGWNGLHRGQLKAAPPVWFVGAGAGVLIGPTRRTLPSQPPFAADPASTIQFVNYTYPLASSADVKRLSEHKRGRPFELPRGRR